MIWKVCWTVIHLGICDRLKMALEDNQVLMLRTRECDFRRQKQLCKCYQIKALAMGRVSWIFWMGSKCNYKRPYRRDAEGDCTEEQKAR